MAKDATGLVDPIYTNPKMRVDTVITTPAVVHTPVVLGKSTTVSEIEKKDLVTGEVVGV